MAVESSVSCQLTCCVLQALSPGGGGGGATQDEPDDSLQRR